MNTLIEPVVGMPVRRRQINSDYTNGVVVSVYPNCDKQTRIQIITDFGNALNLNILDYHCRYVPTKGYLEMLELSDTPELKQAFNEIFTVERYLTENLERTKEAYKEWVK